MADATPTRRSISLCDLPDALFTRIAEYLACPSQASFAVAMSYEGPSRAVISSFSPCTVLDFGEVERSMAAKLSDDDIHNILTKIDSLNKLKTLKLSGCIGITGSGLVPLTGSGMIDVIDLVVWDGESDTSPSLSGDAVIPIISSIVEVWRNEMQIQPNHSRVVGAAPERYLDLPTSFFSPSRTAMVQDFEDTYCQSVLTDILVKPAPKRNMSSFFLYYNATRGDVKAANPTAPIGEIAQIISRNFKNCPKVERDYWDQKAKEDLERYRKAMSKWHKSKRLKFNRYHTGAVAFRNSWSDEEESKEE
ncbi:hypothetical protein ACHAWF_005140 [Thalassiosira exigua]